jgi:NADH-quinone oxidoreductase subunit M
MILLGTWKVSTWTAVVAGTGVIFGAVYMLWMFQRVMFGPLTNPENQKLNDLGLREVIVILPLLYAAIWMGVQPNYFFRKMEVSVGRFVRTVSQKAMGAGSPTSTAALEVESNEGS